MKNDIAKVLTGQRCIGKSLLLFQLMQIVLEKEPKETGIIYINFEDFAFSRIQTAEDMHAYITPQVLYPKCKITPNISAILF